MVLPVGLILDVAAKLSPQDILNLAVLVIIIVLHSVFLMVGPNMLVVAVILENVVIVLLLVVLRLLQIVLLDIRVQIAFVLVIVNVLQALVAVMDVILIHRQRFVIQQTANTVVRGGRLAETMSV